ncbi:MAG: RDD family protein [Candidatus Heimdallarchaeota archaeon]|nr:RDD family protein [Candidatus Heimdallarchaeota archaeon]
MIKHAELYRYLEQVSSYLPLSQSESKRILDELETEYLEGAEQEKTPENYFGEAKLTAQNIMQGIHPNPIEASISIRAWAYLFDSAIIGAFLTVFFAVPFFVLDWETTFDGPYDVLRIIYIIIIMIYSLTIFGLAFSLYFIPEKWYAQSLGKKVFGLYVLDATGIKISWKQAIIRNITKFTEGGLPLDVFLGWLIKKEGQTLTKASDILAETKVVLL